MRIVCSLLLALWAYTASAEPVPQPEFFKPYAATQLRLPSVPLFTNDPYFSLWSPFDRLNEGSTRHWSDAEKAMDGLLRVDGMTYRFMGDENRRLFKEVVPMASAQEGWTARVSHQKQNTPDWTAPAFDDTAWNVEQAAWGTVGEYPFCRNLWNQQHSDIYIRRAVDLTAADLKKDLWLQFSHDDDFELFINGQRIVATGETWVMGEQHCLSKEEMRLLKPGFLEIDALFDSEGRPDGGFSRRQTAAHFLDEGENGGFVEVAADADHNSPCGVAVIQLGAKLRFRHPAHGLLFAEDLERVGAAVE